MRFAPDGDLALGAGGVALLPLVLRYWWVLALSMAIASAIGFLVVSGAPKVYQAEVALLVGPVNTDVSLDASGALASTYAEIATSQKALVSAIGATGAKMTPLELKESVTAVPNQVTRIVTVTVEDRDAGLAARIANALARHLRVLSGEVDAAAETVLERFADDSRIAGLSERTQLEVNAAAKRVFGPSTAGLVTVLDPAAPPEKPARPIVPLTVGLAAICGLVIATILILFKESRIAPRPRERF